MPRHGLSDGMLPTLDELIATMAEAETATEDTARHQSETLPLTPSASARKGQRLLRKLNSHKPGPTPTYRQRKAEEAAEAQKIAERHRRLLTPMRRPWTGSTHRGYWVHRQAGCNGQGDGESLANVTLGRLSRLWQRKNGMSTVEMAQHYATLGVKVRRHIGTD